MEVVTNCKPEGGSAEEKASSGVDPCSNASSIVSKAEQVPITRHEDNLKRKPSSRVTESPTGDASLSTIQPANKRVKIENEETTVTTTAEIKDAATVGRASDNGPSKAPLATTTTAPVTATQTPLALTNPVSSPPVSAVVDTSSSATSETSGINKPLHSIATTTPIKQEQEGMPSTSVSACPTESAKTTQSLPLKVEASSASSNNSQGGSHSIVTACIDSSSQGTSQCSNTSAVSSNDSFHESDTNRSAVASVPPMSTTTLPSAIGEVVQPASTEAAVPAASPQTLKPPPSQAINQTARPQNHTPQAITRAATTTAVPPTSKPVPVRNHVPPSSTTPATAVPVAKASAEVPLKSLNFSHLRIKYLGELEYMLREFQKLERQLLGAKGAQQLEESVGSRERREKLHSFILHLGDTIRQIEIGCKIEVEGRNNPASTNDGSTSGTTAPARDTTTAAEEATKQLAQESALSNLTKEKEEEETVQKLEEHILANLLPVKVRLKKQLAAQQGATQNPPGMPARRGSMQPSSAARGKGTFVEAVEKKRKHAESLRLAAQVQHERQARREVSDPTQFGKPLSGVGSSLTKKLHGSTLGSKQRRTGHGVGSASLTEETGERKILHAGMVPKSAQRKSGLSAASGVHEITKSSVQASTPPTPATAALAAGAKPAPAQTAKISATPGKPKRIKVETKSPGAGAKIVGDKAKQNKTVVASSSAPMSEEERLKYKKHRRLRKLKRLKRRRERELARQQLGKSQQLPNAQAASNAAAGRKKASHSKVGQKKKGPRVVEYICSQCSEAYSSTCELNPWWALAQHKCPKCGKTQIPRIDITSPANTIEYHPALLSHLEDGGRGGAGSQAITPAITPTMPIVSQIPDGASSINSESDSDLSELSDDNVSMGSLKAAELESELQSMTPAERAEHETFGKEYNGPLLAEDHAAKLLILMSHASTCPCHHKSEKQKEVCRSTKYMMLHVRDCPGTTATCDVCPFPWCRKIKHLLYHLVSCENPDQCAICSPKDLPKGLQALVGLNGHRTKKHREHLIALAKASQAAKNAKANPATKKQSTSKRAATAIQATRKATSETKPVAQPRPAPIPAKPKTVAASAPAPYITTASTVDTGVAPVSNPMVAHPATEAQTTDDLDFVINQEIAKLDELASEEAAGLTKTCTIVPSNDTAVDYSITQPIVEAPVPYTSMTPIPEVSETTTDTVLPTPVASIQMDEHDADARELSDLLATNSSEDHKDDDLNDIAEYLKADHVNENVPMTDHQQQIDMHSGVLTGDPNSDPLANMNHEIVYESTDLVPEVSMEVQKNALMAEPITPAVTAEAQTVEKAVGSVAVN
mmetsp:Transcript_8419/g.20709  ORF Transcript_8419/g.20709 Transcript_8419/m.20709 type:complete len:1336 (+) Transcript_8419:275-4282(+)